MAQQESYQVRSLEQAMENVPSYYPWLFHKFDKFLGKRVLEIGSGSGAITQHLATSNRQVTPSDVDPYFIKLLKIRYPQTIFLDITKPFISSQGAKATRKSYNFGDFDTIVAVNVLEHISDGQFALQNMNRFLKKGGNLVILVPAHEILFGSYDRMLGHHRRYTKEDLAAGVKAAGFRIIKISYINKLTFFGWFLNARILKLSFLPKAPIIILKKLTPFLDLIDKFIPFDFGISVICIAKKA